MFQAPVPSLVLAQPPDKRVSKPLVASTSHILSFQLIPSGAEISDLH